MTRSDPNRPDGSARTTDDKSPSGTRGGADVTSRMSGTHRADDAHDSKHDAKHDSQRDSTVTRDTTTADERYEERVVPAKYKNAKTSAAAVFALVFGLAALFCALTGILAPAAVLFGLIGIVLGVVGLKKSKLAGVTGKGVAIGGLVTALLGLLLGAAVLAGAAVYVNDQGLDNLQQMFDDAVENAPSGGDIVDSVPGTE